MIPTFYQQMIGTVVRAALVALSTWMAAHGGPSFTDNQIAKAVAEATPVLIAILWSFWQKYKSRIKLLTAQAAGSPVSENHVDMMVASGQAPSVFTPKHEAPTLQAPTQ